MTKLHDFTLEELMIFTVSVLGAFSACSVLILKTISRSKCSKINLCCISCDRDTSIILDEERLEMGKSPRPKGEKTPISNESSTGEKTPVLQEPEAEI